MLSFSVINLGFSRGFGESTFYFFRKKFGKRVLVKLLRVETFLVHLATLLLFLVSPGAQEVLRIGSYYIFFCFSFLINFNLTIFGCLGFSSLVFRGFLKTKIAAFKNVMAFKQIHVQLSCNQTFI